MWYCCNCHLNDLLCCAQPFAPNGCVDTIAVLHVRLARNCVAGVWYRQAIIIGLFFALHTPTYNFAVYSDFKCRATGLGAGLCLLSVLDGWSPGCSSSLEVFALQWWVSLVLVYKSKQLMIPTSIQIYVHISNHENPTSGAVTDPILPVLTILWPVDQGQCGVITC